MASKIFSFVPAFGQTITATTFLTTHALAQHLASKGIAGGISTFSFPDIAELRAMAMTIWYDTMPDSTHLLFIDADMGFPPEMVTDMLLLNEGVVGAIYPQRKLPLSWAGSGTGAPNAERRGNFMEVEGIGFGCTLIRRDVVTTMLEKMPHIVDTRLAMHPAGDTIRNAGSNRIIRAFEKLDLPDRGIVSEDLSFCIRYRQCGGRVWGAIGYRMSHVGPFDYQGRYLDGIEAAERDALAATKATAAATIMPLPPMAVTAVVEAIMPVVPVAATPPETMVSTKPARTRVSKKQPVIARSVRGSRKANGALRA